MNPAIVFKSGHSLAIIARVTPASVEQYLASPLMFKKLLHGLADLIEYNTDANEHQALPIGPELTGRWVAASSVGQEHTNPPYMWEFDSRVQTARSSPVHSLVIYPDNGFREAAYELDDELSEEAITQMHEARIRNDIETFLGAGALVAFEHEEVRSYLDDILDGDWDGGGECTG